MRDWCDSNIRNRDLSTVLYQPSPNPPQIFQGPFSTVLIKVRSYNKVGKLELLWDSLSTHWIGGGHVIFTGWEGNSKSIGYEAYLVSIGWGSHLFNGAGLFQYLLKQKLTWWPLDMDPNWYPLEYRYFPEVHLRAIKTGLDIVPLYLLSVLYVQSKQEGSDHRSLPCSVVG